MNLDTVESIHAAHTLIEAGQDHQAALHIKELMDGATQDEYTVIRRVVATFQEFPFRTACARLERARRQFPQHAELISACIPTTDPGFFHPVPDARERAEHRNRTDAPAGQVHRRRTTTRRPNRNAESRAVTGYAADNAHGHAVGYTDTTDHRNGIVTDRNDYDRAAVPELLCLPCLSCTGERSGRDRKRADGLCEDCRESGRPGIVVTIDPEATPAQRVAHTIALRCEYYLNHCPESARALIRVDRRHADRPHKAAIDQWVMTNTSWTRDKQRRAADAGRIADIATLLRYCEACGDRRQIRDGLCADCRKLTAGHRHAA